MAWFSRGKARRSGDAAARRDATRSSVAAACAIAIRTELAEHHAGPRALLSYGDAVDLVCHATGWPVGHVWIRDATGWRSSGAWHDSALGPQAAELKAITAASNLGSGRGIVAAVLFLEACRFLPGLEGLGSASRRDQAAALGLRAVVGVPVRRAGRVEAVLEFITADEVDPDGTLAEALLAVAGRTRRRISRTTTPPVPRQPSPDVELPVDLAG